MIRYLFVVAVACASVSFAKGTWEEQQARAEEISAEYQSKYPNVHSDCIVFKTVELPDGNKLDLDMRVVRPATGGPFPVVFFVQGGAWATGSKAQFTHESYVLADNGIAGVRMEYRWKKHGAKYPEAISDVMDAIDFVRQRAGEYNLDFTRVGLAGGSAGGHLSAIAAQLTPECICYDGFNGLFDAFDRGISHFGGGDYTGTIEKEKKAAFIEALRSQGELGNTLIIITSDNGGWPFPETFAKGHNPNQGLRGRKGDAWEGGHRVPFVVAWGDGLHPDLPVPPGARNSQLVGIQDMYATLADLVGSSIKEGRAIDSISFLPALIGKTSRRKTMVMQAGDLHDYRRCVRERTWKLMVTSTGEPEMLFDLETDLMESTNLIDQPEQQVRIRRMLKIYQATKAPPIQLDALIREKQH